jgi:hypothetical protein
MPNLCFRLSHSLKCCMHAADSPESSFTTTSLLVAQQRCRPATPTHTDVEAKLCTSSCESPVSADSASDGSDSDSDASRWQPSVLWQPPSVTRYVMEMEAKVAIAKAQRRQRMARQKGNRLGALRQALLGRSD